MVALGILPCSGNLSLHGKLLCGLLCCHALELGMLLIQQVRNLHRGQEICIPDRGSLSRSGLQMITSGRVVLCLASLCQ